MAKLQQLPFGEITKGKLSQFKYQSVTFRPFCVLLSLAINHRHLPFPAKHYSAALLGFPVFSLKKKKKKKKKRKHVDLMLE